MKLDRTLVVVESPLQFLNAYECIRKFNVEDFSFVIRLSGNDGNDRQLKRMTEILDINEESISWFMFRSKNRTVFDYVKFLYWMVNIFIYKWNYNDFICGNFKSRFIRPLVSLVGFNKVIVVDDGNSTIDILNLESKRFSKLRLFSTYESNSNFAGQIILNDYSFTRREIVSNSKFQEDVVLFIGSGISEIGIVSEEKYLELLSKILKYFSGKNVLYIPHRVERKDKIASISKLQGVTVKNLNYPIEFIGLFDDSLPSSCCSFYSSALVTLKSIYGITPIAFKFDYNKCEEFRDEIEGVYQTYDETIQVIELEKN